MPPTLPTDQELRAEVRFLGEILGEVIALKEGEETLDLEERVRQLSKARRQGEEGAEERLHGALWGCSVKSLFALCRAFSIFFDLANLAEDRHRVRVLRQREREREPSPRRESIRAAIAGLKSRGMSVDELREVLRGSLIEPVFTAHPTEAKRRAVRMKLRRIRKLLEERQTGELLAREQARLRRDISSELTALWETDLLRADRPTVMEEMERSLFVLDSLWLVVPGLAEDLEQALGEHYPELVEEVPTLFRFGTWIGGDRDGNPFVTASVTAATLDRLRQFTLSKHREKARELMEVLTQSSLLVPMDQRLIDRLEHFAQEFPALGSRLSRHPSEEVYRRFLTVLDWRLEQTALGGVAAYRGSAGLVRDLKLLENSLAAHRPDSASAVVPPLRAWRACAESFGFCTARLDIRDNAKSLREAVSELIAGIGLHPDLEEAPEQERIRILDQALRTELPLTRVGYSEATQSVIELFGVLEQFCLKSQGEGLGAHIVSMTERPSDILGLLWLRRTFCPNVQQPLAPLLETVDDLRHGPDILEALFSHPLYRESMEGDPSQQLVMIGYSDSTKDGGYLSANWNLYQSQRRLAEVAQKHGVGLLFFHGRGGALGRGGGPAARSILSLPVKVARAGLRVTEQGEVLAERYDDPAIAYRHLEQLLWAQISIHEPEHSENESLADKWAGAMDRMSETALKAYRDLLAMPGFLRFFREITPIAEIEQLPIGSRPSRRDQTPSIENLRAIPWSFAWTQARILLPAWYGLGLAFESHNLEALREMYQEWSFFAALVGNATLALTKADMGIAEAYARRQRKTPEVWDVWTKIQAEHARSKEAILKVTGERELLDSVPWLAASLTRRNPYVDPLNLIQLRAFEEAEAGNQEAPILMRLAIKGIAAGLRTTG